MKDHRLPLLCCNRREASKYDSQEQIWDHCRAGRVDNNKLLFCALHPSFCDTGDVVKLHKGSGAGSDVEGRDSDDNSGRGAPPESNTEPVGQSTCLLITVTRQVYLHILDDEDEDEELAEQDDVDDHDSDMLLAQLTNMLIRFTTSSNPTAT